jgi:hypothetical protein
LFIRWAARGLSTLPAQLTLRNPQESRTDGEPRAGAGAGVGCGVVAGTGRVASGAGGEMAVIGRPGESGAGSRSHTQREAVAPLYPIQELLPSLLVRLLQQRLD